jgi:hypothetical protein
VFESEKKHSVFSTAFRPDLMSTQSLSQRTERVSVGLKWWARAVSPSQFTDQQFHSPIHLPGVMVKLAQILYLYVLLVRINTGEDRVYCSIRVTAKTCLSDTSARDIDLHVKGCPFLSHTTIHVGEQRNTSTYSSTSTLDAVEWLISRLSLLYAQRNISHFPLQKRLGGPQDQSGRLRPRKTSHASTGNQTRISRSPGM